MLKYFALLAPASKYKHLKGKVLRDKHIENIKGFDQSLPAECDGIQVNARRIAIPLSGPGGRVAIFNLENTGKIGSSVVPALVSGYKVMDLAWDPFDDSRIAIGKDYILFLQSNETITRCKGKS